MSRIIPPLPRLGRLTVAALLGALVTPVAADPQGASAAPGDGPVIVVSLDQKRLWYVRGGDTLFAAPIAIGKGGRWELNGKVYDFRTPRGTRTVLAKEVDPSWTPPDWHYYEKAMWKGLEPVHLSEGDQVVLSDSSVIEVRDGQVGRRAYIYDGKDWRHTDWQPFTPGMEIMFEGKMFIPPLASEQRRIPDALGPVKLALGDGYLIHGTNEYNENSIGGEASHGCIRMRNEDVERLFGMVSVGTRVQIY